jgi:hypothetical protein
LAGKDQIMTKAIQQQADCGFGTWLMDLLISRQLSAQINGSRFSKGLATKYRCQ